MGFVFSIRAPLSLYFLDCVLSKYLPFSIFHWVDALVKGTPLCIFGLLFYSGASFLCISLLCISISIYSIDVLVSGIFSLYFWGLTFCTRVLFSLQSIGFIFWPRGPLSLYIPLASFLLLGTISLCSLFHLCHISFLFSYSIQHLALSLCSRNIYGRQWGKNVISLYLWHMINTYWL